jgi:hypothetical protein
MNRKTYFFCALLLTLQVLHSGQGVAQTITVIPATINGDSIELESKEDISDDRKPLNFNLSTLPDKVELKGCKLQLTVKVELKVIKRMNIRLGDDGVFPTTKPNNGRLVTSIVLNSRMVKDSVLSIPIDPAFIQSNKAKGLPLVLEFDRQSNAKVSFFGGKLNAGAGPRLVIEYQSLLPQTPIEWSQDESQAARNRRSPFAMEGAAATNYESLRLTDLQNIHRGLLMYREMLYVVDQNPQNTQLFAVNPISGQQTMVVDGLTPPLVAGAIDPFGGLYLADAGGVTRIDLTTQIKTNRVVSFGAAEIPTASPTIGADGRQYYPLNGTVTAYSPAPQHQLLWHYSLAGTNGPVALNAAGTVAYFVNYKPSGSQRSDSLLAVNANNGRRMAAVAVTMAAWTNEKLLSPLVTEAGTLYLPDRAVGAKQIEVFDARLKYLGRLAEGGGYSMPVAAAENDAAYCIRNGALWYLKGVTITKVKTMGGGIPPDMVVQRIVSDRSGHVYCSAGEKESICFAFLKTPTGHQCIAFQSNRDMGVGFQGNWVVGADGTLFGNTSSKIYRMRADFYETFTLTSTQAPLNNRSFRGQKLMVSDNLSFVASQTWVGKEQVRIGEGVTLAPTARLTVQSGGGISFGKNFKVSQGATLRCRTGY